MKKLLRSKLFIALMVVIILAAGGGGYFYYTRVVQATDATSGPALQTAKVRKGDITITASGSGNLLPATELDLGFRTGGTLTDLAVAVGDRVDAGQVLARLDDTDARAQVAQAEINLRLAELKLAELTKDADPVSLATAQASLAAAQADLSKLQTPPTAEDIAAAQYNLASAQEALNALLAGLDPLEVENARLAWEQAKNTLWAVQLERDSAQSDYAHKQAEVKVANAEIAVQQAEIRYKQVLAGATEEQIAAARAKVATAQDQLNALLQGPSPEAVAAAEAKVAQAQAQINALLAGASSADLEVAELGVRQARYSLEAAQRQVESTVLRAPVAGTVIAVNAQVGEAVGTAPIITLADLATPLVRFWVEENDLISVAPGNPVDIVFEALPDYIFAGQIVRVDPALVTVDGTPAVQAWASVDLTSHPVNLLSGMTAEVEIIAGEAKGALLVPVQALRELAPGQYAVFVVKPDGELELRPVTVGLKDFANAEILSGLELGEVVSTGTVETE